MKVEDIVLNQFNNDTICLNFIKTTQRKVIVKNNALGICNDETHVIQRSHRNINKVYKIDSTGYISCDYDIVRSFKFYYVNKKSRPLKYRCVAYTDCYGIKRNRKRNNTHTIKMLSIINFITG